MRYIDKETLRRSLPLAYALEQLGVMLRDDGKGLCPFHDDHEPSLQLYVGDDGVERWRCYACTPRRGGDVYDFLMELRHISFPEALNDAELIYDGMPPQWESRARPKDPDPVETPADWEPVLRDGRLAALSSENIGVMCIMAGLVPEDAPDDVRRDYDRALVNKWGWVPDRDGNILIPHRNPAGDVTGVKVRARGGAYKYSRRGSRFEFLYGLWHGRRHRDALLCEGESDAVWASMQDAPVDILALPSGAGADPEDFVAQLSPWNVVYLALDADRAGVTATRSWLQALGDKARVCRLPYGYDLRDARPDLRELVRHAIAPTPVPQQVTVQNEVFVRNMQSGQQKVLTSWYCEPTARLVSADDDDDMTPALRIDVYYAGNVAEHVITADDLASSSKMRKWAFHRELDCLLSDGEVQMLQSYLTARAQVLPDVFQTGRVGIHTPPASYRYAGRTFVAPTTHIGKVPWQLVGRDDLHTKVHMDSGPVPWEALDAALHLGDPLVVRPIIAWLAATTRRLEVQNFPLMFIGGSSGAGKSTLAHLLCRMFCSSVGGQLGSMTRFPLTRMLSATTTLPVFIDEWTLQSREDTRHEFQGSIPIIYEGGVATRGRADLSMAQYRCTSPIMVAGEDTFQLDRERDRIVGVEATRSGQNPDALRILSGLPLERIGFWFNDYVVRAESLPPMPNPRDHPDRPAYNLAVLATGWDTLNWWIEDARAHAFNPAIPELPILSFNGVSLNKAKSEANEYDVLMREALALHDSSGNRIIWEDIDRGGTWVRLRAIMAPDVMRRVAVVLPGGPNALKGYLEGRGFKVHPARRVAVPPVGAVLTASFIEGYFPPEDG